MYSVSKLEIHEVRHCRVLMDHMLCSLASGYACLIVHEVYSTAQRMQ